VRRINLSSLGSGVEKSGRDKSSGSRAERLSAPVQIGMEGDGAWPAV